jgi:hypothetical protein
MRLSTGFDNRLESHLKPAIHPTAEFQDGRLERDVVVEVGVFRGGGAAL